MTELHLPRPSMRRHARFHASLLLAAAITGCGGSSHGTQVNAEERTNQPPVVNAGSDFTINIEKGPAKLHATVTDDGLPPPGKLTITWKKKSGPGDVTFSDPHSADTKASFSTVGSYVLRITADDGLLQASDDVTVTVGSDDGTFQPSVSQFGITWTFDQPSLVGHFANGDWWVVGPVSIVAIDPASVTKDDRTMNGSMINPPTTDVQGYDSAMYTYPKDYGADYDPKLNVGLEISKAKPLVIKPGNSLVSTISIPELTDKNCLDTAAILTVLQAPAAQGSMRPPYCGTDKKVAFNTNQFNYSLFQKIETAGARPVSIVAAYFERPWLDHIPGWRGEEYAHPKNNLPNYSREMSTLVGVGALTLNLNLSDAEKEPLLINLVQVGIDNQGVLANGGQDNWVPNGGMGSSRFFPILLAGVVLDDPFLKTIGDRTIPSGGTCHFAEIDQTFVVAETSPGVINQGIGGYNTLDIGMPEWGIRHWWQIQYDLKDWGAAYRLCCTANSWGGSVLASRMMGIKPLWRHDALFDYQDRYVKNVQYGDFQRFVDRPFTENMWDQYRPKF